MIADEIKITYVGGPTALFEVAGLRFLTDPTFDPKDSKYDTGLYVLHKLTDPSIKADKTGRIDFVLLSHDHHFDNLDIAGRQLLSTVDKVYTTPAGAERLGANSVGLRNWETVEIPAKDGRILVITGTPCRHGPVGGDRGPVTGFVLNFKEETQGAVYVTGDTVWFEGVEKLPGGLTLKW
jgi:L-ascorbate metabolism protein UlaG (beta-lactamase superfamily)